MHHLLFLLVCFIWGSSFILMKRATGCYGAVMIGALRVFGGALFLAVIWTLKGSRWPFERKHYIHVLATVLLAYLWPFTIQPFLVAKHGGAFIGMMISLVPLLTVLISIPMLKIVPTSRQLFGVLGGLGFLLWLMNDGASRQIPLIDILMTVSVPLSYALGNTYIKRNLVGVDPLGLSLFCLSLASLFLLPMSFLVFPNQFQNGDDLTQATVCLAILGLICTGLASYVFYILIQNHGPLYAGMVAYLIPMGALLWGWADGETITTIQVLGLCGVMVMVALVQMASNPTVDAT